MDVTDLETNKFNLIEELESQTSLVIKYGEIYGKVKSDLRKQEETLKNMKNDHKVLKEKYLLGLELAIRKTPFKYGIVKPNPSESVVKAIAKTDSNFENFCKEKDKDLRRQIAKVCRLIEKEAKHKSYVDSADHKRSALKELVKLLIGGFFDIKTSKVRDEYNELKGVRKNGKKR